MNAALLCDGVRTPVGRCAGMPCPRHAEVRDSTLGVGQGIAVAIERL